MANLSAHILLAAAGTLAASAPAQTLNEFLARQDQFAPTFTGAKAAIRYVNHVAGVADDEVENGAFLMKHSKGEPRLRIDFTGVNAYTVMVGPKSAEIYHPKIDEIQVYDLRAYKDIAQKYLLLGFGMPGRELAANYDIRGLKHDTGTAQAATYVQLVPKSPDVLKQLTSVEIWISDTTRCPVRQIFHFPDGSSRTADFSSLQVNPKIAGDAFDLPKSAKRTKVN